MALPDKDTIQTTTSSFMGLQSYTEEQSGSFFGRDAEIEKLTTLINSNTLTIVFGKSGTGKTSLLNAGVFPKLHKNYCLPFRIRLNFNEDSPNLIAQIKNVLKTEIDKYGFKVKAYPGEETLWEYFHKEPLWKSITPILIFDQFEEMFTLAGKNKNLSSKEIADFWQVLSNLAENSIPESLREQFRNLDNEVGYNYKKQKVKIVFAFREEFLPEFESISRIIPSIKTSRFRLMPMNGHQALEVITKTWKENIQPTEARQIVSYLEDEKQEDYDLMVIEPSLLSQVCAHIDKERTKDGYKTVSKDFLKQHSKENILRDIYEEALAAAATKISVTGENDKEITYNPVKKFLENKLITTEGYRTRYSMGVDDEEVRPGIDELKERYFIREDEKTVELTHDVLTPIIKADRETRRKNIAVAAERKKAKRKAILIILIASLLAIAGFAFITYNANEEKKKTEAKIKELNETYSKDSLRLDSIRGSISAKEKELNSLINRPGNTNNTPGTTADDSLNEQRIIALQLELENMRSLYNTLEVENAERKKSLSDFAMMLSAPDNVAPSQALFMERAVYREDRSEMQSALDRANRKYDSLLNLYNITNRLLDKLTTVKNPRNEEQPVDTTNALLLNLFYSKEQNGLNKPADNTPVYLIPYNTGNRHIIRKAKLYEISCNDAALSGAEGFKQSRFHNGKFVFEDVSPGKYFVKICGYYGGFYTINKTAAGTVTEKLDASPPIR